MISFLSWAQHNKSDYWLKPWNTTQIPWHVFLTAIIVSRTHVGEQKQSENTAGQFVATHKTSHNESVFFLQARLKNQSAISANEWSIRASELLLAQENNP